MKILQSALLILVGALLLISILSSKNSEQVKVLVTGVNSDAAEAHKTANGFMVEVSKVLQTGKPKKVVKLGVEVEVKYSDSGQLLHVFRFEAIMESCSQSESHGHIDRRGRYLNGASEASIKNAIDSSFAQTQEVMNLQDYFKQSFGGVTCWDKNANAKDPKGSLWYAREIFCVAPK